MTVWRKRLDGRMTGSERRAIAGGAAPGHLPPAPPPAFGDRPCEGLRARLLREHGGLEARWWARSTGRFPGRGSRQRPVPRAGHVRVADAPAMLDALAPPRAKP